MAAGELRRQPILEAMIRVAGRKGYQATTVGNVVADARASRATFYKYFDDKRDCFLAAHELSIERILAAAQAGCHPERPWRERALEGLGAVVALLMREPELGHVAIIEVAAAGEEAQRRHWTALDRLARMLDQDRRRVPRLPPSTALMAVSGVVTLISDELRAGRVAELARMQPELEFALLVPFLGPREIGRASCRERV